MINQSENSKFFESGVGGVIFAKIYLQTDRLQMWPKKP